MENIQTKIETTLQAAVQAALGSEYAHTDPVLRPAANDKFGDFQANLAMALGKKVGKKPRDLAEEIVANLDKTLFKKIEVAGPGFINLIVCEDELNSQAQHMLKAPKLGAGQTQNPKPIVVDYSAPNVAKQMHVGHLRSTVIGDALCRILGFQGHTVIRQNHLGDWGTQFGMLIEYMEDSAGHTQDAQSLQIDDLDKLYKQASAKYNEDENFARRARRRVVALQAGDEKTLKIWKHLVEQSKKHFNANYQKLGVLLTDDDIRAESSYNNDLTRVINDLDRAGLLKESQGAKVVYPKGFTDRDNNPLPMIVQKSDGGFLYATTDLAAAHYRIDQLKAQRVIYVTDSRQSQHFAMVFETLKAAGWSKDVRMDHVSFGTILGKDHKPFKTRSGETVKLADLIEEAKQRALRIIDEKSRDIAIQEKEKIADAVAIGALKYADLSSDRVKDYVFDFDRMLAMDGNTAPYLQNAYVRIHAIFRKAEIDPKKNSAAQIIVTTPAERALVLKLLQLPQAVEAVEEKLQPHLLCTFLYELATAFHRFYENCPVLTAPDETTKQSRLALCQLSAVTLKTGLNLLGIETVPRM